MTPAETSKQGSGPDRAPGQAPGADLVPASGTAGAVNQGAAGDAPPPARKPPKPELHLDQHTAYLARRFWRDWVVHRWRKLLLALFLMALVAGASAAYPQVIKYAYDSLNDGDVVELKIVVALVIGVTAFRALVLYLQVIVANGIVLRTTVDLQKAVFAKLLGSDYARLARDTPGHMVSRLTNDMQYIQAACLVALNSAVRDSLTLAAVIAVMFYTDWLITFLVLCVYPLAAVPIVGIGKRLRRTARRTQADLANMTSELSETLGGARLIKTYRLEDYTSGRLNERFDNVFRLRMKAVRAKAALDPMLEALGGVAVGGVIALTTYRISTGDMTVGDFMAFLTALFMAAQPIRGLGNLNARLQEGLAAVERVFSVLDEQAAVADAPTAKPLRIETGKISFRDVTFRYEPDEEPVVRGFTLDVPGASTLALVGRSGAGKSTIINLVPRLFDVTDGRILVDGQNVRDVTIASLRDAVSIVSQDITLFNDTVYANIAMGRLDASRDDVHEAARQAMAHEFISTLPDGYDTVLGDRGMRLSGGQRQRIALARAILKDAPILLLDEATSALDTESERLVQQALATFSRDRTTLVIAHRLSTVQNADCICVMDRGVIVETGRHGELIAAAGAYADLVAAQIHGPSAVEAAGEEVVDDATAEAG